MRVASALVGLIKRVAKGRHEGLRQGVNKRGKGIFWIRPRHAQKQAEGQQNFQGPHQQNDGITNPGKHLLTVSHLAGESLLAAVAGLLAPGHSTGAGLDRYGGGLIVVRRLVHKRIPV